MLTRSPAPHHFDACAAPSVWLLPDNASADVSMLSAAERVRAAAFTSEARRKEFLLAHALLRRVLCTYGHAALGRAELVTGEHGKPAFAHASAPQFNLTHARGMVALALNPGGPVGIDVEPAARRLQSATLAPRYCHEAELDWLAGFIDEDEHRQAFLRLWVRKEAVLKARGDGVHGGPRRVDAVSLEGHARYSTPGREAVQLWRLYDVDAAAGFLVSAAFEADAATPTVFDARALFEPTT